MKKTILFLAAAALLTVSACTKEKIDPQKPAVFWESNPKFDTKELTSELDAVVTVTAPGKIEELKLVLGLGKYNLLANPHIKISSNKGTSSNPVFDLVADPSSISFVQGLGMAVGAGLKDKESVSLDLRKIMDALFAGQIVENNSTFSVEIRVRDASGNEAGRTARFHYTAGPTLYWNANPEFKEVDLDASAIECKVEVWAPGKIKGLTVKFEDGGDEYVTRTVKNRTTEGTTLIDLVGDLGVADSFKGFFPAASVFVNKDQAILDFSFMYDWKYDMSGASVNVFTVTALDGNGKETVSRIQFRKK